MLHAVMHVVSCQKLTSILPINRQLGLMQRANPKGKPTVLRDEIRINPAILLAHKLVAY